jgi:hypothetical protein
MHVLPLLLLSLLLLFVMLQVLSCIRQPSRGPTWTPEPYHACAAACIVNVTLIVVLFFAGADVHQAAQPGPDFWHQRRSSRRRLQPGALCMLQCSAYKFAVFAKT